MYPPADPVPVGNFISAMAFIIILGVLIGGALALKKRLENRGVRVYAQVTHRWDAPRPQLVGLSDHTTLISAQWTDPQSQHTYYFAKQSHHPDDYREGDFVPAMINLQHPWFRRLDI